MTSAPVQRAMVDRTNEKYRTASHSYAANVAKVAHTTPETSRVESPDERHPRQNQLAVQPQSRPTQVGPQNEIFEAVAQLATYFLPSFWAMCILLVLPNLSIGVAQGQPAAPVSYTSQEGQTYTLYPWFGQKVVLLTQSGSLDAPTMTAILAALDSAWSVYEQITGGNPISYGPTTLNGRDIIAEVPDGAACGAACSYLGSTGTDLEATYFLVLYNGVLQNHQYDQAMFYEFGRNFWFYQPQLGPVDPFVTGFAIANRFISMDRSGLSGGPFNNLSYSNFEQSDMVDLLNSYLANPAYTWRNTLLTGAPFPNPNNWDAADLAGSMFYRIYSDSGFDAYQSFWRALSQLPSVTAPADTIRNFLGAAKTATGTDYSFLFKDTLAMAGIAPALNSISAVLAQQTQPIAILGSGFGTQSPYTGDSPYIEVTDVTSSWSAGFGGDSVTLAISSWTDSQISLQGFQGAYGSNGFTIRNGDKLLVQVWNAQTANGPTGCTLTVGQSGPQLCGPLVGAGGIVPVFSSSTTIQPGSWVSIYGTNFASATTTWNGNFPESLGGVSVTINGKPAYLWFVSPTQINLQAPDDQAAGPVNAVVTTSGGSSSSTVTLEQFAPSFSLLDSIYATAIVLTPGSPGNSGAGYDIIGPAGHFSYATRPVKAGETLLLYGVGFGPTDPAVQAGAVFSGVAPSLVLPRVTIGGVPATVAFAGIVEAGLFQLNVVVPSAGSGDQVLQANVGGVATQESVFITLQ